MLFDNQTLIACTISRDVQHFDLLIEDMGQVAGDRWGDIALFDAVPFLSQPESEGLEFVALAIDAEDDIDVVVPVIAAARTRGIRVILVAEDLSPASLHRLLREGADEFIPYPLPEGEFARTVARPRGPRLVASATRKEPEADKSAAAGEHSGVLIPVYSMAGGAGGTTLAVNLAWELATVDKDLAPRVCLIDLGLQFGSVATLLDLQRREAVLELLSSIDTLDADSFAQALQVHNERLHVFTAPPDLVPLDILSSAGVQRLLETARTSFDYVVIDMPPAVADWGEAVLQAAHLCFAVIELDMRSAQNTLRLKRALTSEGLPFQKIRFALNRAPGFADLTGRSRVKRLAESLGISIELQFPNGGSAVAEAADQGLPLAESAPKNALRREIQKLAKSIHDINTAEVAPAPKARARA